VDLAAWPLELLRHVVDTMTAELGAAGPYAASAVDALVTTPLPDSYLTRLQLNRVPLGWGWFFIGFLL